MGRLDLFLTDNEVVSFSTAQTDAYEWTLALRADATPLAHRGAHQELPEFPPGLISIVGESLNERGLPTELRLNIEGRVVSIKAASAAKRDDGSPRLVEPEESLLVSVDGRARK